MDVPRIVVVLVAGFGPFLAAVLTERLETRLAELDMLVFAGTTMIVAVHLPSVYGRLSKS